VDLGDWNSVALTIAPSPSLCDLNEFDYRPKQTVALRPKAAATYQKVHHLLQFENFPPQSQCPFPCPVDLGWSSAALVTQCSPSLCNPNEFGCYRSDDLRFHRRLHPDNFRPNPDRQFHSHRLFPCFVDLGDWSSAALKIGRSPSLCNLNEFDYRPQWIAFPDRQNISSKLGVKNV
jgi:hypothetical protein